MPHVVVVGAGGNIGSHVVTHLARLQRVQKLSLIDRDTYEEANLSGQNITPRDLGKKKALVQARKAREVNPRLTVIGIPEAVETVPLGKLRADVILACLDSRAARQYVNQVAFRLGVPWIDSGVHAAGLLARVNVYAPSAENPCLECAWDDRDYAAIEQTYPCHGNAAIAPTGAPSSLGALAASLQAIECQKVLDGRAGASTEVILDAAHHKHYVTTLRRNARCRFDHEVWTIEKLAAARVRDVLGAFAFLRVEGGAFVRELVCSRCEKTFRTLRLASRLRARETNCGCRGGRVPRGFGPTERLEAGTLSRRDLGRTLSSIGLRHGDVVALGEEKHFEIQFVKFDEPKRRSQNTAGATVRR